MKTQRNSLATRSLRKGLLGLLCAAAANLAIASGPDEHQAGMHYSRQEVKDIPWSIHIVKVDRRRTNFRWVTTMGQNRQIGMSLLSDQIKLLPTALGRPLAGINGDFYRSSKHYPGDPEGVQIVEGELVSAPVSTRSCMWIDSHGSPYMTNVTPKFTVKWPDGSTSPMALNEERGSSDVVLYTEANGSSTRCEGGMEFVLERGANDKPWLPLVVGQTYSARVRAVNRQGDSKVTPDEPVLSVGSRAASRLDEIGLGARVEFTTHTMPSMAGARTAIGGGPALVRGGKALPFKESQARHPRSAIGWNDEFYFAVEVDGRQRSSAGMSLSELATYMAGLGCTEALNLDGGGSATMWVYGGVINSPSEGRERPSANGLVLVMEQSKSKLPAKP